MWTQYLSHDPCSYRGHLQKKSNPIMPPTTDHNYCFQHTATRQYNTHLCKEKKLKVERYGSTYGRFASVLQPWANEIYAHSPQPLPNMCVRLVGSARVETVVNPHIDKAIGRAPVRQRSTVSAIHHASSDRRRFRVLPVLRSLLDCGLHV